MKAFKVTGTFLMGRNDQDFTKEVLAEDETGAKEQLYCILGSKHGVKRQKIEIQKIEALAPEQVTDSYIKQKLKG